jgi:hypothetical protein
MTFKFSNEKIEQERKMVFTEKPLLHLIAPCKINEGILRYSDEEKSFLIHSFEEKNLAIRFFIPASGSGSRMFQFLYEFRDGSNEASSGQVERFFNAINEFAFSRHFPDAIQRKIDNRTIDFDELLDYLLNDEGLGYGRLPKGLVPFHKWGPFVLTPFQEHLLQGKRVHSKQPSFHFTIQSLFENQIKDTIASTEKTAGFTFDVAFSEQSVQSNSLTFKEEGELYLDKNGEPFTRPSGHGALLPILNEITEEIIFIKNIDNVQHFNESQKAIETWQFLGGLLIEFKKAAQAVFEHPTHESLVKLNNQYQLFDSSQIASINNPKDIRLALNKPTRVCGMVKNSGQPGGGPFWIERNGHYSKQIVEKAQISDKEEQHKLLVNSTHFNPVMIAMTPYSMENEKLNLLDYRNDDAYFVVHKKQDGTPILYIEQPGLWNGGMENWNTIFVEIPSETFSPVKTVLDLLESAHVERDVK